MNAMYENAAHNYAHSYYNSQFGPYGQSTAGDISGAVERALAEAFDSSVRYDMPDPERELWEVFYDHLEEAERQYAAGNLWAIPPQEEVYGYDTASRLSETLNATARAFGLFG
jgi:hypothetical protein